MIIVGLLRLLLHPLFKWVYNYEFKRSEYLIELLSKKNRERIDQIDQLSIVIDKYNKVDKSIIDVTSRYKWNYLFVTHKNEPIVISHNENNLQHFDLYLTKIHNNKHIGAFQCHLSTYDQIAVSILRLLNEVGIKNITTEYLICICDITCREWRRGYARALLEFLIKLAIEKKYKTICGWLSYTDRERHEWLKVFYQSLGFEVYMTDNNEGVIIKYL